MQTNKNMEERKEVGGTHYEQMKIEPVDYIMANNMNFLEGNVIKYVTRHRLKNGKQDIEKAIDYLKLIIKYEYSDTESAK